MRAEIVCCGTELLLGNIVNTNAAYIARHLAVYGVDVYHHTTVGDNLTRAAAALATAIERADAVIVTGGIGPTPDDCTRDALARVLGVELVQPPELLAGLEARYASWGRQPSASSFKQIELPAGTAPIPNPTGSAVGVLATPPGGAVVYLLPGVPSEMERMLAETVWPDLRARFGLTTGLFQRTLHVRGMGESVIADRLAEMLTDNTNPTVATYVKNTEVEVRLTVRAVDRAAAEACWAPCEAEVRRRLGDVIFGADDEGYERRLGRLLSAQHACLVTAESCTGGLLGERVTSVAGSSSWYLGGVVTYANAFKEQLLGIDAKLLATDGAVSAACARAMALGALERLGGDVALSCTGIAGPAGGTPDKPVGLVYIGLADRRSGHSEVIERRFGGSRDVVRERTVAAALELAIEHLSRDNAGDPPAGR